MVTIGSVHSKFSIKLCQLGEGVLLNNVTNLFVQNIACHKDKVRILGVYFFNKVFGVSVAQDSTKVYVADENNLVATIRWQFGSNNFFRAHHRVKGAEGSQSYQAYYEEQTCAGNFKIRQAKGEYLTTKPQQGVEERQHQRVIHKGNP